MNEPLLNDTNRYTLFPIKHMDIWEAYNNHKNAFWTAQEIDYTADLNDWENLSDDEKFFIENILAFFAGSDGIVLENLVEDFSSQVKVPEARCFYGFQAMIENIHCVSGDTKIMTDKGYFNIEDLENQKVNVWNGEKFSNVEIKYTGNQPLYRVTLSNGMELDCTDGHKWLIRTGNPESCCMEKIETKDLEISSVIHEYDLPTLDIEDKDEFKNPYIHGFFCGDGTYCNTYPITDKINKPKFEVPINYSMKTKLEWLAGLCDADGCVNLHTSSIQINSIDKHFLKDVQILLTTLGIHSNLSLTRKVPKNDGSVESGLYISCHSVDRLMEIGFKPHRLDIINTKPMLKSKPKLLKIESIEKISDDEKTYCFNEPLNHTGIFNGILTGQSEVYSLLIDTFVKDQKRKIELFEAIDTIPAVAKKAQWALKWINKDIPFATRLIAFAIVEGIFFSGSFCSIFWLKNRGKMVKALGMANDFIARDEGLHTNFAVLLYKNHIVNKLPQEDIFEIIKESVEIEREFICDSLPCNLIGMNSTLMYQYIKFVADRLSQQLGYDKIYNVDNPFPFMETIGLDGMGNFFEGRVSEYTSASSVIKQEDKHFILSDDF
jgi:ribonucleotide reductase beta subunit family protein with ferritin-like domain